MNKPQEEPHRDSVRFRDPLRIEAVTVCVRPADAMRLPRVTIAQQVFPGIGLDIGARLDPVDGAQPFSIEEEDFRLSLPRQTRPEQEQARREDPSRS